MRWHTLNDRCCHRRKMWTGRRSVLPCAAIEPSWPVRGSCLVWSKHCHVACQALLLTAWHLVWRISSLHAAVRNGFLPPRDGRDSSRLSRHISSPRIQQDTRSIQEDTVSASRRTSDRSPKFCEGSWWITGILRSLQVAQNGQPTRPQARRNRRRCLWLR